MKEKDYQKFFWGQIPYKTECPECGLRNEVECKMIHTLSDCDFYKEYHERVTQKFVNKIDEAIEGLDKLDKELEEDSKREVTEP